MLRRWMIAAALLSLTACATTTVTKDPGSDDKGVRYYRPKPFLLIQPAENRSEEFVSLSLVYMPDFSEEYSIRVRAGWGMNETNIKLQDGWNLTQIDQKLDSQTDENIRAVADLIGNLPVKSAAVPGRPADVQMVVKATNVPLGFYEAIVSRDADGKKRMYGWRYVGFQPFAGCPIESSGVDCQDCRSADLYALVFERGVMTFKPIGQVDPLGDSTRERLEALPPP